MAQEIERKWHCKDQAFIDSIQAQEEYTYIEQRYFHEPNHDNSVARVRIYYVEGISNNPASDDNYKHSEITVKTGRGIVRTEVNVPIDYYVASDLMYPHPDVSIISKKRYTFPYGNEVIDFDIYQGENAGLVHIEIEFETKEEALAFVPPAFFGDEVTDDMRHTNSSLQDNPYTYWEYQ